jgi:dTDP-glucose 4,6-dehydratase
MISDFSYPINLGNPDEINILEFAHTIIELTGSNSKIVYNDLPVDDPKVRRPDITRAVERLEWKPKVGLRDGLTKTIDYFKRR